MAIWGVANAFMGRLPRQPDCDADRWYEKLLGGERLRATQPLAGPVSRYTYCSQTRTLGWNREFVLAVEDHAGEITRRFSFDDWPRQRLLDCDGIVMFIDPMKSPEERLQPLRDFFTDLQARRAGNGEQPVNVPVALVVPKIDMLRHWIDFGTHTKRADQLLGELSQSRHMNEGTTLQAIEGRSALIVDLLHKVLPLTHIRSLAEAVVGQGLVSVFPVATLGWHESPYELLASLGPEAHEYLMKLSFGVLDPVLWLLHQLGVRPLPA